MLPSDKNLKLMQNYVRKNSERVGLTTHPTPEVTEMVVNGLAKHMDDLKKPLCPCRFYPDKQEAVAEKTWLCPCEDMKQHKYCHCLLFVNEEGNPVTEHLPEGHEGLEAYGFIADPAPKKGRKGQRKPIPHPTVETPTQIQG